MGGPQKATTAVLSSSGDWLLYDHKSSQVSTCFCRFSLSQTSGLLSGPRPAAFPLRRPCLTPLTRGREKGSLSGAKGDLEGFYSSPCRILEKSRSFYDEAEQILITAGPHWVFIAGTANG